MIDQNDYTLAWQSYWAAGVVATLLWALLIRAYRINGLKLWALLSVAALLLLPSRHPEAVELWMPATMGAALSVMTDGVEAAMASIIIIAIGQVVALLVAVIFVLRGRGRSKPAGKAKSDRIEPGLAD